MTNTNYPHNLNAEAELLSCMMIHSIEFDEIFAVLKPKASLLPTNRNVALRQQRNVGLDVIFIDYLKLIQSGNK